MHENRINILHILLLLLPVVFLDHAMAQQEVDLKQKKRNGKMDNQSIIIFGASYARGWNPESIVGLKVINKGIGGNESGDMIQRYSRDVLDLNPSAIIIWGFINDIFRSTPEKLEQKKQQTKQNLMNMVEIAIAKGIAPILVTEVTITTKAGFKERVIDLIGGLLGKESYADYVNKHVIEINHWLRELAFDKNLVLLDFEKVLADSSGRRKREFAIHDGSHLSEDAYEALNSYTKEVNMNLSL